MSSIGTTVAAGVAQTALNAQQTARTVDRTATQTVADAKRLRELVETHLRALEEGDEFESPAQLHIDSQVPDHSSGGGSGGSGGEAQQEQEAEQSQPILASDADQPQPSDSDAPLYRHLDLQA